MVIVAFVMSIFVVLTAKLSSETEALLKTLQVAAVVDSQYAEASNYCVGKFGFGVPGARCFRDYMYPCATDIKQCIKKIK